MSDIKPLSAIDATPIEGPHSRSLLDSAVVRFIAAVLAAALCAGIFIAAGARP